MQGLVMQELPARSSNLLTSMLRLTPFRLRRGALLGLALIAAVAATGCGDKTETTPATTTVVQGWEPNRVEVTIATGSAGSVVGSNPRCHKKKQDIVRWYNTTSSDHRITFLNNEWPFEGTPHDIVVPKSAYSGWFIVRTDASPDGGSKFYKYSSVPPISGPPGDPGVTVED